MFEEAARDADKCDGHNINLPLSCFGIVLGRFIRLATTHTHLTSNTYQKDRKTVTSLLTDSMRKFVPSSYISTIAGTCPQCNRQQCIASRSSLDL